MARGVRKKCSGRGKDPNPCRRGSAVQPIFPEIDPIVSHRDPG